MEFRKKIKTVIYGCDICQNESQYCHGLQKEIKKYELELNQLSQRQQKYNEWKSKEEDKLIRHQDKLLKIQSELATCSVKKLNFSVRYEELQVSNLSISF